MNPLLPALTALSLVASAPSSPAAHATQTPAPPSARNTPHSPPAPKPVTMRLNNGARLVVLPDEKAEVVAIHVFFLVGLADEGGKSGINALLARAWGGESENRIAALLRADVARVGSVGTDFAEDWVELWGLSGPDEGAVRKSFQTVLTNLVANPRFSPEAVEAAKEEQARALAVSRDSLLVDVLDRLRARLFGPSPYDFPPQGTPEGLFALKADTLTAYYNRLFRPARCVIAVAGRIEPEAARKLAEDSLGAGGWNDAGRGDAPAPPRVAPQASPVGLRDLILPRRAPGGVWAVGLLAPGTDAAAGGGSRSDYAALVLLDAVLGGGKSARLFSRLRDGGTAPVGYDVRTLLAPNRAQSLWAVYVVGDQDAKACREAVLGELAALADGARPVTPEEVARARAFLKVRHLEERQRVKERAYGVGWAEVMGLGADFDAGYAARLDAVTADDVNALARRVLGGGSAVVYTLPPAPSPPAPPPPATPAADTPANGGATPPCPPPAAPGSPSTP